MDSRSDTDSSTSATSRQRNRRDRRRNREREKVAAKAVVRHLPPAMSAEEFVKAVEPLPPHNFFYFSKSDHGLGSFSFSRAYINFLTFQDLESFRDKFDGYVFVDTRGNEFPAVVEFAPFQKIPDMYWRPSKLKRDPKCGTIEKDDDYLSFLESLEAAKSESLPSAETLLPELEARDKELKANRGCLKVTTPLIQFVQSKYQIRNKVSDRTADRKSKDGESRNKQMRDQNRNKKRDRNRKSEHPKNKDKDKVKDKEKDKDKNRNKNRDNREEKPAAQTVRRDRRNEKPKGNDNQQQQPQQPQQKQQQQQQKQHQTSSQTTGGQKAVPNQPKSKPTVRIFAKEKERKTESKESSRVTVQASNNGKETERIPNKKRPALQIYRPGGLRNNSRGGEENDDRKNRQDNREKDGTKGRQERKWKEEKECK